MQVGNGVTELYYVICLTSYFKSSHIGYSVQMCHATATFKRR